MLNQLHATADIAADRRRTLLAEAEAHRLGRLASATRRLQTRRRNRLGALRLLLRRATGGPACGRPGAQAGGDAR